MGKLDFKQFDHPIESLEKRQPINQCLYEDKKIGTKVQRSIQLIIFPRREIQLFIDDFSQIVN